MLYRRASSGIGLVAVESRAALPDEAGGLLGPAIAGARIGCNRQLLRDHDPVR
ncbi:hypothetical protein GTU71_10285 [Rathayibacter sp. VKM Ac-2762]|uniref:hypothetical protein n=1 Tax=Rathayibacter caricis TaxID=110936 RepID=UPI00132E98BD|nr:hypothetical protein GTU71_10285 [Rathayibacter sp. VKM Ac-2762]